MPLTSIKLSNFKCFADSGEIPLAPLTVIFGRNNSGKSSILQPLLLLRQTLDSPEYGVRLNLRGLLWKAGSYGDIVHQHLSKQHIIMTFGVDCAGKEWTPPAKVELEFRAEEPQPPRLTRLGIKANGIDALEIRRSRGRGGPYELVIGGRSLGLEKAAGFQFPADQFLPRFGEERRKVGRPSTRRVQTREFARNVLGEFEAVLRSMRAVGAFRRQPERRHEYVGQMPDVVDLAGENVVNALIEDAVTRRRNRGELLREVNRWLRLVGRVRLMPVYRISRTARIFELRLKDIGSGRWANFADVGFGIGQALPVLVEGLRTPPDGTFLVQEPEIHPHPDAQLGMADFLINLARSGRRVIAETHSEHLLLRLRRKIVQPMGGKRRRPAIRPSEISLIHVDQRGGSSYARKLEVDELAQIRNWPRGFMEEATQERISLLEEAAKRAESTG